MVFRADQEIGRDLLAVDWAATPLGPVDGLAAKPSYGRRHLAVVALRDVDGLGAGPDILLQCRLPPRHPGRQIPVGSRASRQEVWAEIWDDIGSRVESVMSAGESTWDEALMLLLERSGYLEETYHTFSYSPLRDDDARRGRHALRGQRGHRPVIGERRMATLRISARTQRGSHREARCWTSLPTNSLAIPTTCRSP